MNSKNGTDESFSVDASFLGVVSGFLKGESDAISKAYDKFASLLIIKAERHIPLRFKSKISPDSVVHSVIESFIDCSEKKLERFKNYEISSWAQLYSLLATITIRKCMNRIRAFKTGKRSGDMGTSELMEFISDKIPSPEEEAEYAESVSILLGNFSENEMMVLDLRMNNFTVEEIAKKLNFSTTNIKSIIKRLQRKTTRYLKENQNF